MARKRGRCRRGQRLRAAVPHGHYKTVTLVPGLRLCGLVAQKAFDRSINAASFEEWEEKCLVPSLMDNLSRHKGPRVEQLIKAAGAELRYLPPYSPDMNPIEKAYSKLKAFLRKIAERTVAGLLIALDACADIFKPAECVNYFKTCGYDTGRSVSALTPHRDEYQKDFARPQFFLLAMSPKRDVMTEAAKIDFSAKPTRSPHKGSKGNLMVYKVVLQRNGQEIVTIYWSGSLEETTNLARTIALKCEADRFRIIEFAASGAEVRSEEAGSDV
jgi:transposase